jgi:hypothetical protein
MIFDAAARFLEPPIPACFTEAASPRRDAVGIFAFEVIVSLSFSSTGSIFQK